MSYFSLFGAMFFAASPQTPVHKRARMCEKMRESLHKMGRKTSGVKAELEERLENSLNTNCSERLTRGNPRAGKFSYLASGAHCDVYKGEYLKGPRRGQHCVYKKFKSGSVYDDRFFQEDVKAVAPSLTRRPEKTGVSKPVMYSAAIRACKKAQLYQMGECRQP